GARDHLWSVSKTPGSRMPSEFSSTPHSTLPIAYDASGNTALVGAHLLYELLCVLPGVAYR
ncbi:MAG: hypothetical protein OSB46_18465, partial [Alphaproteobacteria bacterium]|nr:hypothetical protein [Alphaproteobacteria bacterium]